MISYYNLPIHPTTIRLFQPAACCIGLIIVPTLKLLKWTLVNLLAAVYKVSYVKVDTVAIVQDQLEILTNLTN